MFYTCKISIHHYPISLYIYPDPATGERSYEDSETQVRHDHGEEISNIMEQCTVCKIFCASQSKTGKVSLRRLGDKSKYDICMILLYLGLLFCAALLDIFARHPGSEDGIPVDEEWLREVGFDSNHLSDRETLSNRLYNFYIGNKAHMATWTYLVVDVVVVGIVGARELEGVPRQPVAAMIINSLEGGDAEEEHGLAGTKLAEPFGDASAGGIEEEALDGVVVECAKRVGDVKTVVP